MSDHPYRAPENHDAPQPRPASPVGCLTHFTGLGMITFGTFSRTEVILWIGLGLMLISFGISVWSFLNRRFRTG